MRASGVIKSSFGQTCPAQKDAVLGYKDDDEWVSAAGGYLSSFGTAKTACLKDGGECYERERESKNRAKWTEFMLFCGVFLRNSSPPGKAPKFSGMVLSKPAKSFITACLESTIRCFRITVNAGVPGTEFAPSVADYAAGSEE
jgi:hypothetical protein